MDVETKSFAASVDSLEPIRDFISQKCNTATISKKKTYGLCLAVDEIATNIIKYGYPKAGVPEGDGSIELIIAVDDKKLMATLADSGFRFDPFEHTVPDEEHMKKPLEERQIGGLGILLARQNVDVYTYEVVNGKNLNIFTVNVT